MTTGHKYLADVFGAAETDLMTRDMGPIAGACDTVLLLRDPTATLLAASAFLEAEKHTEGNDIVVLDMLGSGDTVTCKVSVIAFEKARAALIQDRWFASDTPELLEIAGPGHRWVVIGWVESGVSISRIDLERALRR